MASIIVPITSAKSSINIISQAYQAAVFLAEIPDLRSYEVVDAIFHAYCYQLDLFPSFPYVAAAAFVGPNATWDESTTDLSGVSMQPNPVGSLVIVDAVGWWEWNVYGDSSVGLKKILDDTGNNPGPITISLRERSFYPLTHENPKLSSHLYTFTSTVAHFSDTDDPTFFPYLEIIIASTGDDPDKRKSYSSTAAAGG